MQLTILGSGSPEPYVRRASSGYLLDVGSDVVLIDCGGGVFDNLLRAGRKPSDVTHIVFSHLHSDHMMDYARLVHAAWDQGAAPAKVYGPAPIAEITEKLFGKRGVFAHDLRSRTALLPSQEVWKARGGTLPRSWPAPDVREIEPGEGVVEQGWTLASCRVPHAQPALVCMGISVAADGRKFVYSGDAGLCPELTALAKNADLLLHWCYRLDGEATHPAMINLTPTPSEIGRMAQGAGVRKLLLTHFRVHMDAQLGEAEAALAASFDGPGAIVEDLQTFDI